MLLKCWPYCFLRSSEFVWLRCQEYVVTTKESFETMAYNNKTAYSTRQPWLSLEVIIAPITWGARLQFFFIAGAVVSQSAGEEFRITYVATVQNTTDTTRSMGCEAQVRVLNFQCLEPCSHMTFCLDIWTRHYGHG